VQSPSKSQRRSSQKEEISPKIRLEALKIQITKATQEVSQHLTSKDTTKPQEQKQHGTVTNTDMGPME
jgi:hypothetical protein